MWRYGQGGGDYWQFVSNSYMQISGAGKEDIQHTLWNVQFLSKYFGYVDIVTILFLHDEYKKGLYKYFVEWNLIPS